MLDVSAFTRFAPVLGVGALVAGGLSLILYSARLRAEELAKRVEMVQPKSSRTALAAYAQMPRDDQFKEGEGLSAAEYGQISRLFAKYGIAPDKAILYFGFIRLALLASLAVIAGVAALRTTWPLPLLIAAFAAAAGWYIPIVVIRIRLSKYRKDVALGLPDAIELLAICADAGISLESSLQKVAHELSDTQPALSSELALTSAQISLFPNRDQALFNFVERNDFPGLRSVIGTLSQSMRYGTPLTQSLRQAATEMRTNRLLKIEERANRLPALMTLPVMLLIMPTVFLIVGGPAFIKIMDTFKH